jgi:hypothetical protein
MMGFLWGRMDSGKNDSDNSHRMRLEAQGQGARDLLGKGRRGFEGVSF